MRDFKLAFSLSSWQYDGGGTHRIIVKMQRKDHYYISRFQAGIVKPKPQTSKNVDVDSDADADESVDGNCDRVPN